MSSKQEKGVFACKSNILMGNLLYTYNKMSNGKRNPVTNENLATIDQDKISLMQDRTPLRSIFSWQQNGKQIPALCNYQQNTFKKDTTNMKFKNETIMSFYQE